jgi:hypothetical protein
MINTYDIDGVIYFGKDLEGLTPTPKDMIITGRSFEERPETMKMLSKRGIENHVLFNNIRFDEKTRVKSGIHKGDTLNMLKQLGYEIGIHFEDDEVQIQQIKKIAPWVNVVHVKHDLVEKENVRHIEED